MSIFEKCERFYSDPDYAQTMGYPTSPRMAQALGLYPYFLPISQSEGTEVIVEGRRLLMLGSNNYLGLTNDPRVKEAARAAVSTFGTSCTGSRFLNGTLDLHLELEERLAAFTGKEKALVFSTGFQANIGAISALLGEHDVVIVDKEVHASILDGIALARGHADVTARYFRHNNMPSLDALLAEYGPERSKLVIVDGVFSMSGDIAPLPEIVALCKRHHAQLMVDDAHGLGVLGGGRGTAEHFRCTDDVDLLMGTFSKSFASVGGFIAGKRAVIHWIQHFAKSFMFSASLPPANLATVLAILAIIQQEPERVTRLTDIGTRVRASLRELGYNIGSTETPIIPIIIGDQYRALQAWGTIFKEGIYTNVALPPAVHPHRALLRTSYMATHTEEQVNRALDVFARVRLKMPTLRKEHSTA